MADSQNATPTAIAITTTLNNFDLASDTYGGWVQIYANPRANVGFNVSLPFHNAKNEKDALAGLKTSIDKIVEDIHESAAAH